MNIGHPLILIIGLIKKIKKPQRTDGSKILPAMHWGQVEHESGSSEALFDIGQPVQRVELHSTVHLLKVRAVQTKDMSF